MVLFLVSRAQRRRLVDDALNRTFGTMTEETAR
jgi:hypothetical protein